ncbi:competence protein f [hydrocarbon metagenome]|uniref:Competence protein f n=1 Tax=hydrocarbon metagenome TaxID=938273 RepID=A0A0W8G756_9ZZZZ
MAFVRGLWAAAFRHELFFRRCRVCGVPIPAGAAAAAAGWPPRGVCAACAERLAPRQGGFCPRCGAMEADPAEPPELCAACLILPRPFAALAFHAPYGDLLRDMILAFKFGERPQYGAVLRGLLLSAFERAAARAGQKGGDAPAVPDMVVPVPLYPRRLAWRGFNQSLELARPLARKYGWPIEPGALARIRDTRPQSTLSGRMRRENIQGAFAADATLVRGRTVLLTDDVMTTGATVEAAAKALRAAGASRVDVLVLAR